MAQEYSDLIQLCSACPAAMRVVMNEIKMQCPDAIFVRAVVGLDPLANENNDFDTHLMALFDLGNPNMLLWVWVPGTSDDPYIDEFYEVPTETGNRYLKESIV